MDSDVKHRFIRTKHSHLRFEFIPELAVLPDGVDRDLRFIAVLRDAEIEFIVFPPAHRFANELRPELRIPVPSQPIDGPTVLQVGKKCGGLPQSILPSRENRILAL